MVWRLPQILIAMLVVLVTGLVSVWFMESRMGGATVPGLVLIEAPQAGQGLLRSALAAAGSVPPGESEGATERSLMGTCEAGSGRFEPFGQSILERLHDRGDTMVLYLPEAEIEAVDQSVGLVAWPAVLPSMRPTDSNPAERAAGLLGTRQELAGFCIGLVLGPEADLAQVVVPLLAAMNKLPEFRRASLVVMGARDATDSGSRGFLRFDRGPWKGDPAEDLTDLLEAGW
jgi:hypothetical protein